MTRPNATAGPALPRHPRACVAAGRLRATRACVVIAAVWTAVATGACKKSAGATSPGGDFADDIGGIEAALARNEVRLQAEGIVIAQAPSKPAAGDASAVATGPAQAEPPPPEQPADDDASRPEPSVIEAEEDATASSDARPQQRAKRRTRRATNRCERICELADATCGLANQVCELSARHGADPRYQRACSQAQAQCNAAAQACNGCESP